MHILLLYKLNQNIRKLLTKRAAETAAESANNRVMANSRRTAVTQLANVTNETSWLQNLEKLEDHSVNFLVDEISKSNAGIIWNVGLGDGFGLLDFTRRMSEKAVCKLTNIDHVIRISVPSISEGCISSDEIRYKAIMAIANKLQIMDDDNTLGKLKNELEEETYFAYRVNEEKESKLIAQTKNMINKKLASKRCLVIVENIVQSILDPTNKWLLDCELPLPTKFGIVNSYWVVSTTSVDVYHRSVTETSNFLNHHIFNQSKLIEDQWYRLAAIIELELLHVAKSISKNPPQKLTTTMDVLKSCLVYSQLFSHDHDNNAQDQESCSHCVQPKELVNLWTCAGIFSRFSEVEGQHKLESEYFDSVSDEEQILRALLSHFLLYKCNSSNSSSSNASCVVPFSGMGKLLAGLKEGSIVEIPEHLKFIASIWYKECIDKNWVSFCDLCFEHQSKINPTITTLILRGCTKLSKFFLETSFSLLKNLRVLDLSYTSIELLPASLSKITSLRFLSLKGCNQLRTLNPDSSSISGSSPLGPLEHLEFLDLGGVSLDTIPNDVGKSKSKLRYLDLSSPNITSLSSFCFQDISNLRELFLLGCILIESLPSSLTELINLKTFSLSESQLAYFPQETFKQMSKLCDLTLTNNQRLRSLPGLVSHASLKSFSLSGSPKITHLSLRTCQSLETVYLHDLDQLEELDLSATSIKEFPASLSELRGLKRLDLLALPQLKRLPWHKLQQIPKVLNLDTCKLVGPRIFSTESRLFSSLTYKNCKNLVKEGGPLQSFIISVSSCSKRSKNDEDIGSTDQFKNKIHSYYKDIPLVGSTFKQQFEHRSFFNQHVEIFSTERYPTGLEHILDFTKSLSVRDNAFVSNLNDLNSEFFELQECNLGQCHLMDSIFRPTNSIQGRRLQTLWVSDLQKMTKVYELPEITSDELPKHPNIYLDYFKGKKNGQKFQKNTEPGTSISWIYFEFRVLKHVYLEHCPRLESIFPSNLILRSLETLTVIHCGNLRTVFYKCEVYDENQFPKLHTIQLHELPKLSHLCEKQSIPLQMHNWKELHFRGCWNLQGLPLLVGLRDQKVHVDGEARQCKKLKAGMGEDQISYYDFKSPPPLASFRERVKNNIFLR